MSDFSLVQFMCEGGWGMWTTLLLGSAALGASARYAAGPDRRRLAFAATLSITTLVTVVHAVLTNIGAVMSVLADPARVPDSEVMRTLFQGLKEASRPGALGGTILTLAALLISVGVLRGDGARARSAVPAGGEQRAASAA